MSARPCRGRASWPTLASGVDGLLCGLRSTHVASRGRVERRGGRRTRLAAPAAGRGEAARATIRRDARRADRQTTPSPRSAGTRSRSSSASATPRPRARPSSGPARRPGRRRLDWLYDQAMVRAMGLPTGYAELRRAYFGETGEPGPAPASPATLQAVLDEFTTRIAPHTLNSFHPRALSATSRRRRSSPRSSARSSPSGRTRASTSGTRARSPRSSRRRSGAGCATSSGYGEGSFGLLRVGRRDGQLHRDGPRARRPPPRAPRRARGRRAGPRSRASASTPATRRTSRSPGRSTSWASRPRRSSPRPADDALPPPRGAGRRGDRRGPRARACARSRSAAVAGSTNTGSVDLVPELAALAAARGPVAPRRRGVRRRGPAVRARRRPRPGPRARGQRHGRSPQVVLPGLRHRRAARPRRRATCARRSTARPSTTAAARRRGRATGDAADHADDDARGPAQLLQARLRGDPPVPRAQAVGDVEAPRARAASAGSSRRTTTSPRTSRGAAPRPTTSRRCPPSPSCPSCASGTCRAGAAAADAMDPRDARRPPGPPRGRARGVRRRLAVDDRASAGATWLRAGVVNYLTTKADIDRLLATLRRLA